MKQLTPDILGHQDTLQSKLFSVWKDMSQQTSGIVTNTTEIFLFPVLPHFPMCWNSSLCKRYLYSPFKGIL